MQQADDPPSLPVGTEVSAKYKGAFCEAKVSKVVRNIKVKVAYKHGLGSGIVSDDAIKASPGQLRVGAVVEVRHSERKEVVEATITKIQDCSQYTVVFDDGDITTLRRTALCLKSGRHFNESETLDQLPLTHPEHFGNPVVGGRRGRRRGHLNGEEDSEDDDESDAKEVVNEKEENIGKVVCVETESKKKDKEKWFPALVVAPTAQATVRIRVKDEYLVRSFKDGRYYTVPKKEATEFTRDAAAKQDGPAVQAALEYLDADVLPPHWDRDALFGLSNSSSDEDAEIDTESSDDEHHEEKDRFVAQLYKYMDDRGTPLNKVPSIQGREVDLYRLFRAVQKRGGYNRVTTQNQWKTVAVRLGYTPCTVSVMNLVKQAYKKFLQPYGDFNRKLGCSMLMTSRNSSRSKGRSLVRANSVASPKPAESTTAAASKAAAAATQASTSTAAAAATTTVTPTVTATPAPTVTPVIAQAKDEETESTSEPIVDPTKKRKTSNVSTGKVKSLVEKYEEKAAKDEGDVPLSEIKAATTARINESKAPTVASTSKQQATEVQTAVTNRDASPSASTGLPTAKKEKHQRKQNQQSEDKRGKRKKDEVTVEKIDTGDFVVEIGDKLKVYYHEKKSPTAHGSTYEAKVIEISVQRTTPMYLVHYTGWNNRYDEWVSRERIAENITKGCKQKGRSASSGSGGPIGGGGGGAPNANAGGSSSLPGIAGGGSGGGPGGPNPTTGPGDREKSIKESGPKATTSAFNAAGPGGCTTSTGVPGASNTATTTAGSVPNTKTPMATKRGRGRSDSMPPRSTTPSSVASNSSRTKSPAASNLKKRPTRTALSSTVRRTSTNVSDASLATESETDSDEPVRKPKRTLKAASVGNKPQPKARATASVANSPSDTEEDEEDMQRENNTPLRALAGAGSSGSSGNVGGLVTSKGRDYDLSLIRSELKGFHGLKSPSPAVGTNAGEDTKKDIDTIKNEYVFKSLASVTSATGSVTGDATDIKIESKLLAPKEEKSSSTDISSETDSFNDDDSQSSDKAAALESLTKKFQQKINVGKQRPTVEKPLPQQAPPSGGVRIIEHIIKDGIVEKRLDTNIKHQLAAVKEETTTPLVVKNDTESGGRSVITATLSSTNKLLKDEVKDEEKVKPTLLADVKPSTLIAPARFSANTSANANTSGSTGSVSKYTSVIVEKPLNIGKKTSDFITVKKPDLLKKSLISTTNEANAKKFIEPAHKDTAMLKADMPAACSPSSSSSSSSSFCSSASAVSAASSSLASIVSSSTTISNSTRSLPDMSKLEISSSASSALLNSTKDTKYGSVAPSPFIKPTSHVDIYEFKDPEPFEFAIRKSPMVSASTSVITATTATTPSAGGSGISTPMAITARKQMLKAGAVHHSVEQHASAISTTTNTSGSGIGGHGTAAANRKKRGSPTKETPHPSSDKSKLPKMTDDAKIGPSNLVADAKLLHQPAAATVAPASASAVVTAAATTTTTNIVKHTSSAQQKVITSNVYTGSSSNSSNSGSSLFATPLHTQIGSGPGAAKLTAASNSSYAQFDKLRQSPSFNRNINALNEELAQTVQETTRALTDRQQTSPTPPLPPPSPSPVHTTAAVTTTSAQTTATTTASIATTTTTSTATTVAQAATSAVKELTPHKQTAAAEANKNANNNMNLATGSSSSNIKPTTPVLASTTSSANSNNAVSPKVITPPHSGIKPPVTVGSPFIETRKDLSNVFELTTNECSGYSSGESKDNKIELENAKILLSASSGGFDLEPLKYEQKPSSIADKVLKAISQKKEEVENNKTKEQVKQDAQDKSKDTVSDALRSDAITLGKLETTLPIITTSVGGITQMLDKNKLLTEPLKIQTELPTTSTGLHLIGDVYDASNMDKLLGPLSTSGASGRRVNTSSGLSSLNSPEPKTILESISQYVKNTDLSETIQKLECAIQRKTPVGGLSMASSSTPTHTPTSTAAPTSYSDESMDSTDSEQRLVIEDVVAEEQTTNDPQKSPASEASGSLGAPVKLESNSKLLTGIAAPDLQAPIPLKPSSTPIKLLTPLGGGIEANRPTQTILRDQTLSSSPNFSNKLLPNNAPLSLHTGILTTEPKSEKLLSVGGGSNASATGGAATAANTLQISTAGSTAAKLTTSGVAAKSQLESSTLATSTSSTSTVVPIIVPDIPVSVVVATSAVPAVMAAAAALMHSPKSLAATTGAPATTSATSPGQTLKQLQQQTQAQQQQQQQQQLLTSPKATVATDSTAVNIKPFGKATSGNMANAGQSTNLSNSGGSSSNAVSGTTNYYMESSHSDSTPPPPSSSSTVAAQRHGAFVADEKPVTSPTSPYTLLAATTTSGSGTVIANSANNNNNNTTTTTTTTATSTPQQTANDAYSDSINLLCEEIIPGSPAPAFGQKDDIPANATTCGGNKHANDTEHGNLSAGGSAGQGGNGGNITHHNAAASAPNSSPNDSASQDESSEDLKKHVDVESDLLPMKRKRTRKQVELSERQADTLAQQQQQQSSQQQYQSKRRRGMGSARKNPAAGSDTDDNSDTVTPRGNTRHQQQQLQQQQQQQQQHQQQQQQQQQLQQQLQQHQQTITGSGVRPCPYNFLVELDPALSSEQCISILLKQIQELRKTYNTIKGELATIDRRRKKLRRREREKKQMQMQNQQQNKANN